MKYARKVIKLNFSSIKFKIWVYQSDGIPAQLSKINVHTKKMGLLFFKIDSNNREFFPKSSEVCMTGQKKSSITKRKDPKIACLKKIKILQIPQSRLSVDGQFAENLVQEKNDCNFSANDGEKKSCSRPDGFKMVIILKVLN